MPTSGAYEFKLSPKAVGGVIEDEMGMLPGEWAWVQKDILGTDGKFVAIYACCPDCGLLMTLWRRFGFIDEPKGHQVDAQGNVNPSVLHRYVVDGVDRCGFHTMPTRLLDFVDLRGKA